MTAEEKQIPLFDEDCRNEARTCLSSTLMMEAGAGAGKTTLLIERILNLIVKDGIPIDKIAAITFTQKASGEMIQRLRDRLESFVAGSDALSPENRNASAALSAFDRHHISTIHSFARKLLLMAPFDGGVDPDFEVIDETAEQELIDRLWEDWISPRLENPADPFRKGYEAGFNNDFYMDLFKTIYRFRDRFNPRLACSSESFEPELMLKILQSRILDLDEFAKSHCTDDCDRGFIYITQLWEKFCHILKMPLSRQIESLMEWKITEKDMGTKKAWGDNKSQRNLLLGQVRNTLDVIKASISRHFIDGFVRDIAGFMKLCEDAKRKEGFVSNDDLLIKATAMLRNNCRVREYFKGIFHRILVDEFQDTDPLQAELVFLLSEEPGVCSDNWTLCSLMPGKLFFVGDPKQSIYSFRRADIEIYEKVRSIVEKTGKILPITVNFRSDPAIIKWVNDQFGRLIVPPSDGKYQPLYENLIPRKEPQKETALVLLSPEEKSILPRRADAVKAESLAIADFINNLIRSGNRLVSDRNGRKRPLDYGDICILFPKYSIMPYYEEALRNLQIPCQLEGGRLFHHRQEIRDMLTALLAVENPKDALFVAACLKSPLFSHSDEDLLKARLNGISFSYDEEEKKDHPLYASFQILNRLHKMRNKLPPGRIISEIYRLTGILKYYSVIMSDSRALANLEKLQSLAWEFHNTNRGGFRRLIARLEKASRENEKEQDADPSTDLNAVSIMTIHKSKGLEFPVVVLAGLASTQEPRGHKVYIDPSGAVEASYGIYRTAGYETALESQKKRQKAETVRLLYVAATRAKDLLVLTNFAKLTEEESKPEISYYHKILIDTLFNNSPLHEQFSIITAPAAAVSERIQEDPPFSVSDSDRDTPLHPLFGEELDIWKDRLKRSIEKGSSHQIFRSYTADKKKEESGIQEEEDTIQLKIGRAYHYVMENADITGSASFEGLLELAVGRENISELKEDVKNLVKITLASGIAERIRKAESCYREYPFMIKTRECFTSGAIDLLIKERDGYTIIDYKSDHADTAHMEILKNRYKSQAFLYKEAVETLTGSPVKEVLFFFARLGRTVRMDGE